jgi:hypothetical protein
VESYKRKNVCADGAQSVITIERSWGYFEEGKPEFLCAAMGQTKNDRILFIFQFRLK